MKCNIHVLLAGLILLCLLAGLIQAQYPAPGDLVLSSDKGIHYISWPSGALKLVNQNFTSMSTGVRMSHGNKSVYFIAPISPIASGLCEMFPSGIKKVLRTKTYGSFIDLDQDRSHMIANNGALLRYDKNGGYSLFTTVPNMSAFCRDGDTGDFVIGTKTTGSLTKSVLYGISREDGSFTKQFADFGQYTEVCDVACIPNSDVNKGDGEFAVLVASTSTPKLSSLVLARRNGTFAKSIRIENASRLTVNQKTGDVFVATHDGFIFQYQKNGDFVTFRTFTTYDFTGIDIWFDQAVSVETDGLWGHTCDVTLAFPKSPNCTYYVALSMNIRPGITFPVGNETLNLSVDNLFMLTCWAMPNGGLPYFTWDFFGKLDGLGSPVSTNPGPKFQIPYPPKGIGDPTIFVSAVAVNASCPNGLDLGNTEVIKIRY